MIEDKINVEVIYNTFNKICIKIGNKTILYFKNEKKYSIIDNTSKVIDSIEQSKENYLKEKAISEMKKTYNTMMKDVEDLFKIYS